MKYLVCISKVPDTTTKITFIDNNTKFNSSGVQYIINPYDEWYALVRAIELKEQNGGTVTVINVGPVENETVIRKALAIGADNAIRINTETIDAYYTAKQIAEYAKKEKFDIIFLGKETIDYNGSQVGGMLAELLGLPFISLSSKLDINGKIARIERMIEGGVEVVEIELPFVISCQKGMAEARIPNMRGIMQARTKQIQVLEPIECKNLTEIKDYTLPPKKSEVKLIDPKNPEELIRLLHEEAKVI